MARPNNNLVKSAVILEPLSKPVKHEAQSLERSVNSRNIVSGDDLPTVGSEEGPYREKETKNRRSLNPLQNSSFKNQGLSQIFSQSTDSSAPNRPLYGGRKGANETATNIAPDDQ